MHFAEALGAETGLASLSKVIVAMDILGGRNTSVAHRHSPEMESTSHRHEEQGPFSSCILTPVLT